MLIQIKTGYFMRCICLLIAGNVFIAALANAQTTGGNYVSSIEAKAKQILAMEKDIENLKRKIRDLGPQKQASIDNAQRRLAEAIERTKTEASWKNRLKTAQEGWEEYRPGTCSAGGPPPICPANHWFRTDVSKSMAKYNEYLDNYLRPYKDAVANAGKSEQREMDRASAELDQKTKQVPNLRQEIIDLSKKYDTHIHTEAEKIAKSLSMDLVRLLSEIHYQDDLLADYDQRIRANQQQEAIKKAEATEKAKKQIQDLQKKLEGDITQLESRTIREVATIESQITQHNTNIANLRDKLKNVELQIRDFKGSETQKLQLEEQRKQIQTSIYNEQSKIRGLEDRITNIQQTASAEIAVIRDEIFKVQTTQSSTMIAQAIKIVEEAFASKRELLMKSKNAVKEKQENLTKLYSTKLNEKDKSYQNWVARVDAERRRLMSACQSVSCSCFGTYVVNDANLAWNKTKDCLKNIDRVKRSNDVLYGCEEMMAHYRNLYKSYTGSNSATAQKELDQQKAKARLQDLTGF